MGANDRQARYWAEHGKVWVAVQETIDLQLAPFAEALFDAAAPRAGEIVLDVGCGCGTTTTAVAHAVEPGGTVVGVDLSPPMLDRARERLDEEGLTNVELVHADAQEHPFPAHRFDLIVSRFGMSFFADPVAAFSHLRAALKPSGRLVFVTWQDPRHNPWALVPVLAVAPLVPLPPTPDVGEPGPFSLAEPERTRGLLEKAGWVDIELSPVNVRATIGNTAALDDAVTFLLDLGPAHVALADAPEEVRAEARAAVREALRLYRTRRGVKMPAAVWLVSARPGKE